MARPKKEVENEEVITKTDNMQSETTKPKHVFGLKGIQRGVDGKPLLDDSGKPKSFKGLESELIGSGEGLKEYQQYLIKLDMADRASTNPVSPIGREGYVSLVKVTEAYSHIKKTTPELAQALNEAVDFRMKGDKTFLWWFEKGTVKEGDRIVPECKWVESKSNGTVYYNFKMFINPTKTN
jgi:hypothetical protein